MDLFNHPVQLFFALMLSIVSSYYLWRGFREKDVPDILIGIGLGIPPFDMASFNIWLVSIGIAGGGYWLRQRMES